MGAMEKWNNGDTSLTPERRLMNEALARIGRIDVIETRGAARRAGRLMFAVDLTSSREATLREARIATAAMFEALKSIEADRLAVKLVYYRGSRECRSSGWEKDAGVLRRAMEKLSCKAGYTQIARVLRLALAEKEPLSGIVFVGDHCEEDGWELDELAAALGEKHIPVFVFHECADDNTLWQQAQPIFRGMANASGGAYCPFGAGSAAALRELLSTVAAFSAAGIEGVKQVPQATTPEARALQGRLLLAAPERK